MLLYNGKCDPVIVSNKHTSVGFSTDFKTGSRGGRGSLYWTRSGKGNGKDPSADTDQSYEGHTWPGSEQTGGQRPLSNTQHLARWGGLSTPWYVCPVSTHECAYKQFIQIVGYNTKLGFGWMTNKSAHDKKHILEMCSFVFKLVSYVFLFVFKITNHTQDKFKCNDFWMNLMTFETWAKSQLWIQNMTFVWFVFICKK